TAIRYAVIGRAERNAAMIRQFADGGEPAFQRMLAWAADLERSGTEVAGPPEEFWQEPDR
ncbi:MAG: aminoglycoside phosphotransferase family protein, partial [Actinobacteria bacterium]|nr:aminoglycoside phosphotransferase family protein [Actinomycetota bacterium]